MIFFVIIFYFLDSSHRDKYLIQKIWRESNNNSENTNKVYKTKKKNKFTRMQPQFYQKY